MSFADPQSVTIAATPYTLPRVSSGASSGGFRSADGNIDMTVSSTYGRRTRRTVRLSQSKIAADPFVAGASGKVSMSTYLVVDTPVNGFTVTEAKAVVDALVAYLAASTGARVTQLLGGEN